MKILVIFCSAILATGCAVQKPYAQNPFNSNAKIAVSDKKASGSTSNSTEFRSAGVVLAAAERPIPGALPPGANIGIATALLLLSDSPRQSNGAANKNFINANMPFQLAADEKEAQIKIGEILEKSITQAIPPEYKVKIEEYDDVYAFGRKLRPRWLRATGPLCENWSCQILGPIPTENSLQWEGEMRRGLKGYVYKKPYDQYIAFLKISKEYDKNGTLAGKRHFVEGYEISGFDYKSFYKRISRNLPEWISIEY